jgi:hypothetical protein
MPSMAGRSGRFRSTRRRLSDMRTAHRASGGGFLCAHWLPTYRQDESPAACRAELRDLVLADVTSEDDSVEVVIRGKGCLRRTIHVNWVNLPTIISGPPIGEGDEDDLPADVLPVWPERGVLTRMEVETFGELLETLSQVQCPGQRALTAYGYMSVEWAVPACV